MKLLSSTPRINLKDVSFNHKICYIDLDAFFAAVEMRENPKLKGNPIIVGGNPETSKGVVVTCSYEARKYGIHAGMSLKTALKKCPHAVFSSHAYPLYSEVSNNIMNILRQYSSRVCVSGIDEAYFDLSDNIESYREGEKLAYQLKDEILATEGITCSIGLAPNVILAKIASDFQKPNGLTILQPQEIKNFLAPLDITTIPGIGVKLGQILADLGIHKCKDLTNLSFKHLYYKLGDFAVKLWKITNGFNTDDFEELFRPYKRKSISEERTFYFPPSSWDEVWDAINNIIPNLIRRLKEEGAQFKTITIKIRTRDFVTKTRSKTLSCYSNNAEHIKNNIKTLIKEFHNNGASFTRLIGVKLRQLKRNSEDQTLLTQFV